MKKKELQHNKKNLKKRQKITEKNWIESKI